ncbi:sugar ABC transporter permease [Paenibacillus selenitireducens]|uniref:Sugar ABC transporter permease n=1 Tax=Paenibacillus selenitireducens TaxID=1324314 RepID=A0A1T2X325_9BACL|nr:ABC transporter permease subunit [Paenibacillus selenitireducens]OPA74260.1 sugar ABC transporter permease [Paenibacillus selenitireducens]
MEGLMRWLKMVGRNKALLLMVLPGAVWFLLFCYLPMPGAIIAFKDYKFSTDGFLASIIESDWIGLKNFEYLFKTEDSWIIVRNTLLYNAVFIVLGTTLSVIVAIIISQIANKKMAKIYQTGMFLPHFLSWVIVSYFVFSFLSVDKGVLNQFLTFIGVDPVFWYSEKEYWPYILVFVNLWKGVGYGSVIYLAAIVGIDKSYFEAAMIDGASKWQQIRKITIPMITPIIVIMFILAVGGIFRADFGLFYQVPRDTGALYPVTNVIDTFVYRGLKVTGNIGMSTAAGLYQAVVGFVLVIVTNFIVRKINKEQALF